MYGWEISVRGCVGGDVWVGTFYWDMLGDVRVGDVWMGMFGW